MEFTLEKLEELATIKVWELALNGHKEAIKLIEQYEISNPNKQIKMKKLSKTKQRVKSLNVRITKEELLRLKLKAEVRGTSISNMIREDI